MGERRRKRIAGASRAAATRIEQDLLGELAVPAVALYGIHTVRATRNLSFSGKTLGRYPAYIRALAIVKKAAARANRDARVLDPRVATAIERACDALIRGEYPDQFPVDALGGGGSIAVNMNLNEVIANLANEHAGGTRGTYRPVDPKTHVNASQSTADVCHSAIRIAILERWAATRRALAACASASRVKAAQLRPVITIARTCLQDAAPVSRGELFAAHAAAIERRIGALDRSVEALRRINLGGTAIGSGDGAPAAYRRAIIRRLNKITGLRLRLRDNLYDAAQNIDDLAEVAAQFGLLAEVLIKIAQDVRLLASGPDGGLAEIALPATQEGSSFFPGKINPVIAETLLQCCFQVLGCERAARLAVERGELDLNVFEGAAAVNLFDAMEMIERAVTLFADLCLEGIVANEARCAGLAARGRFKV
jgi:aspartate ammonia-lyase